MIDESQLTVSLIFIDNVSNESTLGYACFTENKTINSSSSPSVTAFHLVATKAKLRGLCHEFYHLFERPKHVFAWQKGLTITGHLY